MYRQLARGLMLGCQRCAWQNRSGRRLEADEQEYHLDLEDEDGNAYTGRVVGAFLAEGESGEKRFYLTSDGRLIVYDRSNRNLPYDPLAVEDLDSDQLHELLFDLSNDERIRVMRRMGIRPVVNI